MKTLMENICLQLTIWQRNVPQDARPCDVTPLLSAMPQPVGPFRYHSHDQLPGRPPHPPPPPVTSLLPAHCHGLEARSKTSIFTP